MANNHKPKGATLIETIIYIGIIGFLAGNIILLTQAMLNTNVRVKTFITLERNMQFAALQITEKVQKASNVSAPSQGMSTSLTLETTQSENPTIFSLSAGKIIMTKGAGESLPITSNEIEITNLSFTRLDAVPAAIRVQLTGQLRNVAQSFQTTHTITNTVVIRR